MFASVRLYTGLKDATVDAVGDRTTIIASLFAGVPGCVSAHVIRTREGLIVVIVGDEEAVIVEAGRRFVAWANRNVPAFAGTASPTVWAGDVLLAPAVCLSTDDARATQP